MLLFKPLLIATGYLLPLTPDVETELDSNGNGALSGHVDTSSEIEVEAVDEVLGGVLTCCALHPAIPAIPDDGNAPAVDIEANPTLVPICVNTTLRFPRKCRRFFLRFQFPGLDKAKAGKNAKLTWNMVKNCINFFFTNFQKFLEEKNQNIHLNDEFPLKIANISLQKQNFPGMRFPNPHFFHAWTTTHLELKATFAN